MGSNPATLAATILAVALTVACQASDAVRATSASYDLFTSRLVQLSADQNGDGRLDQWSYFDGNRPLRGEGDSDGDGRVDRWEYFDEQSALVRVGTSSMNDGIEDTWTWVVAVGGEVRIDHARRRDRQLDRREYYRAGEMTRSEEDTNRDGRTDRWDRYEGKVLRQADFDTTLTSGRPNRRLVYDASGRFLRLEADPELDGSFVAIAGGEAAVLGGVKP